MKQEAERTESTYLNSKSSEWSTMEQATDALDD